MFTKDFYPTPQTVIDRMTAGADLVGQTVLEPSAGSGHLLEALTALGAKTLACEDHPLLQEITAAKAEMETNVWYGFPYFEIKGFKKGTAHVRFKDDRLWERFNRAVAESKEWELPEKV